MQFPGAASHNQGKSISQHQKPYFSSFFSNNFDSRGKGEERGDFGAAGGSKVNGSIPKERGKGKHSMSKKN